MTLWQKSACPGFNPVATRSSHQAAFFALPTRPAVSSYRGFQCLDGKVCGVANRYLSNRRSVLVQSVDPRHIHRAQHSHGLLEAWVWNGREANCTKNNGRSKNCLQFCWYCQLEAFLHVLSLVWFVWWVAKGHAHWQVSSLKLLHWQQMLLTLMASESCI